MCLCNVVEFSNWDPFTNRWILGIDKQFHPIFHNECNYLSMLELKLIHVCKRGPWIRDILDRFNWSLLVLGIDRISKFHHSQNERLEFQHSNSWIMNDVDLMSKFHNSTNRIPTVRINFVHGTKPNHQCHHHQHVRLVHVLNLRKRTHRQTSSISWTKLKT